MHTAGKQIDREQANELMQQFAALGYIEDPSADKKKMAESADIEGKYNVSRTYLWKNRPEQALLLLEEITRRRPWEDRFLLQLAACYFQCGYLRQAECVFTAAANDAEPANPSSLLLLSRIKLARGYFPAALKNLLAAEAMNPRVPGIYTQLGDAYARLLQWKEARAAYEKAIALDPDNALAHQGLSTVYRRQGLNQETADTALRAVGLLHRLPMAHFNLGVAMARSGQPDRAIIAFETALRFQPNMVNAHRYLSTLHRTNGGDRQKAIFHRQEAEKIIRGRPRAKRSTTDRSEKLFDLPEILTREERLEILLRERPDPKRNDEQSGKTFILVSGLPRSGTSLMMQMLKAGGAQLLTDGERAADVDNPKGYYEWEPIKQIGKKPELLDADDLDGSVIKCISMLLPKVPLKHSYKVIFMTRPIEEVVISQRAMVNRLATKGAELETDQLQRGLTAHRNETRNWLKSVQHMEFIEVDYPTLVREPEPVLARVLEFLGPERLPSGKKMAACIDPSLHRKKNCSGGLRPSHFSA